MARHADAPGPDRRRLVPALPGLAVLGHYRREWLRGDLPAGLTVAAYLVPQVMAYATVAGLPPVAGLRAIVVPLLRHLPVAPGLAGMHDIDDYPQARTIPGLAIYRYDSPLFFANAEDFHSRTPAPRLLAAFRSSHRTRQGRVAPSGGGDRTLGRTGWAAHGGVVETKARSATGCEGRTGRRKSCPTINGRAMTKADPLPDPALRGTIRQSGNSPAHRSDSSGNASTGTVPLWLLPSAPAPLPSRGGLG
ncbi:SulP family inorganic anion transporter [Kitasatospora sp. NPDC018058]|uniref:SulP family inorganic anion transporter n=1 Tax=Kitasatospora sp. NPDC018058 TaxID=3364025 RepID=UPI0037BEDC93